MATVIYQPIRITGRWVLSHLRTSKAGAFHLLQTSRQLRILLRHLELRARRFGIRQCIHNLTLGPRQFGGAFKVLEGLGYFALLKEELRHRRHGNIAFRVDYGVGLARYSRTGQLTKLTDQGLLAQLLGCLEILLPLEKC
jgi:hypothetical protein